MRDLMKADLRRVFRKHIYWIIPSVILIMKLSSIAVTLILQYSADFIPVLSILAKNKNAGIVSFSTTLETLQFALSLVIFLVLFTDDFKSMTMIGMIGYGMSRKKLVITKFIDSVVLSVIFYIIMLPLIFLLFAVFKEPLVGINAEFVLLTTFFAILKTIANITIAALVLYVTNNIPFGLFSVLILQIIPIGLTLMTQSPLISNLHIDRYYMDGMFNLALTDFFFDLVPEGILMTLLCVFIYIGCVLAGTILYFDKKELDF